MKEGSIAGAVYLSASFIRIAVETGSFRLPTKTEGEKILGGLGSKDTTVVIYDGAMVYMPQALFYPGYFRPSENGALIGRN